MRHRLSSFALFALTLLCGVESVYGQGRGRERPVYVPQEEEPSMDPTEGAFVLEQLRSLQLSGDFALRFTLEHRPRRGQRTTWGGEMWGTWTPEGPLTRVRISSLSEYSDKGESDKTFLIAGGEGGQVSEWTPAGEDVGFVPLEGAEVYKPIFAGMVHSPFDLQTPFIYWPEYEYKGKDYGKGRNLHTFRMLPPERVKAAWPELAAVRIAVDAQFYALMRVEMLDAEGEKLRSYRINSIKKVQDEWIVREIDILDEQTRDKTRFKVVAAVMRAELPDALFSSSWEPAQGDPVPNFRYEPLR